MDTATDGNIIHDFKNFKKGNSVKVPTSFQARSQSTPVKLAYITDDEAGILKALKPGTPHEGPMGIPNYNDFDAAGNYRSGAAMSAAETGGKTERDRADMREAGIGPQEAQDLRSSAIAAGAGQNVNPGFFGPRNRVSKQELARARAFAPQAYRATRGSRFGLGNILGGLAGLVLGIPGLGFGINALRNFSGFGGKDEEDMSEYNELGLYTDRVNPTYYNDLGNEFALGTTSDPYRISVGTTQGNTLDSSPLSIFNTNYPGANKGIPYTDAFTQAGTMDYLNDYTNQLETGQPITNDEQMFVDNEIANLRFP